MSLPLAFGTTLQNLPAAIPYLFADEERRMTWAPRLRPSTKPRIGVAWSGNTEHRNDINRSIELANLAPILAIDADWISLQKEIGDIDRPLLGSFRQISHYGELLNDFSDTAAVIAAVDLVITVDTSVAHLASAMGKPVWILLPLHGGLAMAPRPRRVPMVSDGPAVSTAGAARLGRRGRARRCGPHGFCGSSITH